jgi:hypothetical protein
MEEAVLRRNMRNEDLVQAAFEIQDQIRRAYRLHREHRPIIEFDRVEHRISAYPYAGYRHGLSERSRKLLDEEYRNAEANRQIVVYVKDSGTRRLISFSIDEELVRRKAAEEPAAGGPKLTTGSSGPYELIVMAKENITGRWLIDFMDMWDREFIDAEVRGFFEFGDEHRGSFQFGHVQGEIDYRFGERGGNPGVEFSWNGQDEMDQAQGRGWLVLEGDDLKGMFYIHLGDESGIVLKRGS